MFSSLIHRSKVPTQWQKIPWDDPNFSRRMLAEHLSQAHDLASRRFETIDRQVKWIQREVLKNQPAKILDLGCGPGFYTSRLSALGHECKGVDFSPASIAYARENDLKSEYVQGNVLDLAFGYDYDLVMMIYGELNAFSPQDAALILAKSHDALKPGGKLLLEVHPGSVIEQIGHEAPSWYTTEQGLFSDTPYVCLMESIYDGDHSVTHFYVYDAESGALSAYTNMLQAYTDEAYRGLLKAFQNVQFYPSLDGSSKAGDLFVITAEKAVEKAAGKAAFD